jgi:hypothetical protein
MQAFELRPHAGGGASSCFEQLVADQITGNILVAAREVIPEFLIEWLSSRNFLRSSLARARR